MMVVPEQCPAQRFGWSAILRAIGSSTMVIALLGWSIPGRGELPRGRGARRRARAGRKTRAERGTGSRADLVEAVRRASAV